MAPAPQPPHTDAYPPLTPDVIRRVVLYFAKSLPAPPNDTADDRLLRDNDALAEVAALEPANADEATEAMRCVAAGIWADDQLRLARIHADDFARTQQILRQYAHMLRTANGARALLLRVQTARKRRGKEDPAGSAQDVARAAGLRASLIGAREALAPQIEADVPAAIAATAAAAAAKAAAEAAAAEAKAAAAGARAAARAPQRPVWETAPLEEPPPLTEEEQRAEKWLIAADRFATIYPMRTRLIRKFGKLPDDCGIEQPEPDLLHAIRIGDRFSLRWADELSKEEVYVKAGLDRHLCKYEDEDNPPAVPAPVRSG